MEYSSMSERILRSLGDIIKGEHDVADFTIIPTDDNTKNKSPVLYERPHLGLESWCVKYVYQYVCHELFHVRKNISNKQIGYLLVDNINYMLMGALLINPDVSTFWNMRRELVEAEVFSPDKELKFCKLVVTRKPKSNEAFSYRRWILTKLMDKIAKTAVIPNVQMLEDELQVALMATVNSQNNYHAWTHRIWCMENFLKYYPYQLSTELEFSEKWINEHVSENSGYHYRQFVLSLVKRPRCNKEIYSSAVKKHLNILCNGKRSQLLYLLLGKSNTLSSKHISTYNNIIVMLLYELLIVIDNINQTFKEHESLWLHRRYVVFSLIENAHEYLGEPFPTPKTSIPLISSKISTSDRNVVDVIANENCGEKQAKIFKTQPSKFESSKLYSLLNNTEREFIDKNSSESKVRIDLAKRYESWLHFIVGFH